jgi:uncharacterized protein
MTRTFPVVLPLLLTLLLAACGTILVAPDFVAEPLEHFPVGSVVIEAHGRKYPFTVWVADTGARRSQGLRFVKRLDADRGMLFLFEKPTRAAMWMYNMAIPVDMLFIAADGRVLNVARNATPDSRETIQPDGAVTGIIELPGGTVSRLHLDAGDRVRHAHFAQLAR